MATHYFTDFSQISMYSGCNTQYNPMENIKWTHSFVRLCTILSPIYTLHCLKIYFIFHTQLAISRENFSIANLFIRQHQNDKLFCSPPGGKHCQTILKRKMPIDGSVKHQKLQYRPPSVNHFIFPWLEKEKLLNNADFLQKNISLREYISKVNK